MSLDTPSPSLVRRLGWFVLYWVGGVLTVGVVGYAIKLMLQS